MTTTEMPAGEFALPLTGVRVIDLSTGPLGAIARQLAELGADVLRVEPRQGGADRTSGLSVAGVAVGFVAANLGKRAVGLDLDIPEDKARFDALLGEADILIENYAPDSDEAAILDIEDIHARHPTLVILSATNFGLSGNYRHWCATGPVLHALSGELSRSGLPDRPPLLPPGDIATDCAVAQASFAILLAYWNRLKTGLGDLLDFALLDGAAQALDPGYGIGGSATLGVPASQMPRGRSYAGYMYPIIPCADGYVRLCILAPRQWRGMFAWLGEPAEFADPSFDLTQNRFASNTLIPAIAAFFADKTRVELERAGQRHGVPTAALLNVDEALASDQMVARKVFTDVEIAPGVYAPFPDGLMEIDGMRAGIRRAAPALGQHGFEGPLFEPSENPPAGELPLSGLRVLDLGVIVVGAEQGRLLADQGAEVIKIENQAFPDGSRQSKATGPVSITFAAGHRNKKALGLNLRDPEGKALFLKLVEQSDVVLSNFKPGTMDSLGIGPAELREVNPRIVLADSSAFGPTGPWSKRLGYGPLVRASAGLTAQWRYPEDPGSFSDAITVYPDHVAARIGIIGVLALLIRRLRTGRGGTVNVSQAEVMLSHMGPQIAATALQKAGMVDGAPLHDAPWGVFPCAGDDEWCVVTIEGDADWHALCATIERHDLASDPLLATVAGRDAGRARIDTAVAEWLAHHNPQDAMQLLQRAGIAAGAMLRVSELPDFRYYIERSFFREASHPALAQPIIVENAPVRSRRLPDPPQEPAPLMGQHSVEIAAQHLGLTTEAIDHLVATNILETAASAA